MPEITVKVDHAACSGIGSCEQTAPAFFKLDSENRAVVISNEGGEPSAQQTVNVSDDEAKLIVAAAESCPMVAISVFDTDGGKIYG